MANSSKAGSYRETAARGVGGPWKNSDRQPCSSPEGSMSERSEPLSLGPSKLTPAHHGGVAVAEVLDLVISLT